MTTKPKVVYDCDLFCTDDFVFDGVVRITGNFYASADVVVKGLEVGGDIHLVSSDLDNPSVIDTEYVLCNGSFFSHHFEQSIASMSVGEQLSIEFTGPVQFDA